MILCRVDCGFQFCLLSFVLKTAQIPKGLHTFRLLIERSSLTARATQAGIFETLKMAVYALRYDHPATVIVPGLGPDDLTFPMDSDSIDDEGSQWESESDFESLNGHLDVEDDD